MSCNNVQLLVTMLPSISMINFLPVDFRDFVCTIEYLVCSKEIHFYNKRSLMFYT